MVGGRSGEHHRCLLGARGMNSWSEEALTQLRELWESGRYSFEWIASTMGRSRNSVAGKIHRLGIERKHHTAERPGAKTSKVAANAVRAARIRAKAPKPEKPAPPVIVPYVPLGKPWLERQPGECAFPIGGRGDGLISCCSPSPGSVYCEHHRDMMFVKPPRRVAA